MNDQPESKVYLEDNDDQTPTLAKHVLQFPFQHYPAVEYHESENGDKFLQLCLAFSWDTGYAWNSMMVISSSVEATKTSTTGYK
ncbi:hypothetical protein FRC07_012243 [Ceratobasidium sp. 392]|nr:hypothetical protein FRC07_012243 [Ceratobasidium sp. 392]